MSQEFYMIASHQLSSNLEKEVVVKENIAQRREFFGNKEYFFQSDKLSYNVGAMRAEVEGCRYCGFLM